MATILRIENPTEEEREIVSRKQARLPSDAALAQYRGQLIAVLMQGDNAGTVIANVPLEFGTPVQRHEEIARQVDESSYKGELYTLHQLMPSVFAEEE